MGNFDGVEIDLSGYKERSSAHLTPGKYLVRIEDAESGFTKTNNDPKVTLFYSVVGGPYEGSPLIDTLTLTDKAMFRVVKVLRALGLKVEKKKFVLPFKLIVGRTMTVQVKDGEPYNDIVKSEVQDYFPAAAFEGYVFLDGVTVEDEKDEQEYPSHTDGEPHVLGTIESIGPLGDEVRSQNTEAIDSFPTEAPVALQAVNGEVPIPESITL